ncbi:MAG: hypothetical protein A2Z52_00760 [Candidatus Moranbacteria bacterium RBG_19FT_COMBO_42_6]|nr:MAG: hypothetical protein A2Z52_00760 [Candidatus Moranbacteria bacterium RBG_19FT_COMBO_42_6]
MEKNGPGNAELVSKNKKKSVRKKSLKKILPQMFDIRPINQNGDLDLDKIRAVRGIVNIEEIEINRKLSAAIDSSPKEIVMRRIVTDIWPDEERPDSEKKKIKKSFQEKTGPQAYNINIQFDDNEASVIPESNIEFNDFAFDEESSDANSGTDTYSGEYTTLREDVNISLGSSDYKSDPEEKATPSDEILLDNYFSRLSLKKTIISFSGVAAAIVLLVFGISFIHKGLKMRQFVLGTGDQAYASLAQAKEEILSKNFEKSSFEFNQAYDDFSKISNEIDSMGSFFVDAARFIPFASKISSGSYLAKAGQDISRVGLISGEIMQDLNEIKNPLDQQSEQVSFLKIFQDGTENSKEILELLEDAEENISKVNVEDIPKDKRLQFSGLKSKLPELQRFIRGFLDNSYIFTDVLGGNGPRKYLFLFQNNQEMRATGGFIGSYGAMAISNGRIKKFFIDGIFNPDGQLREKVIPPVPIQKISAAWSLHDSNWFPDFPVSAEKAAWFYEKTGGPTVDGVVAMTPTVMQKLLEITGPIEMDEYGVTVDKDNFVEKIQYEVEIDYEKELNQPKQILADLAPKILDRIFNAKNFSDISRTMNVLVESLNEKQILIYSKNYEIEKKLAQEGWSGEIMDTDKDYLSVINSNINGFKTDGVIDEKIEHKAEIQKDGAVIDTVTITRQHTGGKSEFDWWNKVNADYMRVYVPKGSKLLSVEGQTREFNSPPLDYDALNFKRDPQVESEEGSVIVDEKSGTRIYDDAGKTVFANWVYVSPQETVVMKYQYLLPFRLSMNGATKPADTYSLLVQKQSGSRGSKIITSIDYPAEFAAIWRYPEMSGSEREKQINYEADLKTDKFFGVAFTSPS